MFNSKTIPLNEPIEVQDAGYLRILSLYQRPRYWGRPSSHLLHVDTRGTVGIVETCINSESGHCQANLADSTGMIIYLSLPMKPGGGYSTDQLKVNGRAGKTLKTSYIS